MDVTAIMTTAVADLTTDVGAVIPVALALGISVFGARYVYRLVKGFVK